MNKFYQCKINNYFEATLIKEEDLLDTSLQNIIHLIESNVGQLLYNNDEAGHHF